MPISHIDVKYVGKAFDAEAARQAGLVLSVISGDHDDLLRAAIELAQPAVSAPRELGIAIKETLRQTAGQAHQADAVKTELHAQLASLTSPTFAERLAATRATLRAR